MMNHLTVDVSDQIDTEPVYDCTTIEYSDKPYCWLLIDVRFKSPHPVKTIDATVTVGDSE